MGCIGQGHRLLVLVSLTLLLSFYSSYLIIFGYNIYENYLAFSKLFISVSQDRFGPHFVDHFSVFWGHFDNNGGQKAILFYYVYYTLKGL